MGKNYVNNPPSFPEATPTLVGLYTTLVDLAKTFGTVSLQGLWRIMAVFGSPVTMIR